MSGPVNSPLSADARVWAAFHEAGHAVRAAMWGYPIVSVSLDPIQGPADPELGRQIDGAVHVGHPLAESGPNELMAEICIASAGEAAEAYARSHGPVGEMWILSDAEEAMVVRGARFDHRNVRKYFALLPLEYQSDWVTRALIKHVDEWIERPEVWRAVEGVAKALWIHRRLEGPLLDAVLLSHIFRALPPAALRIANKDGLK